MLVQGARRINVNPAPVLNHAAKSEVHTLMEERRTSDLRLGKTLNAPVTFTRETNAARRETHMGVF